MAWREYTKVDNRFGANGIIAGEAIAKATPDGYSLLATTGSQAINPSIYRKMPYDTLSTMAHARRGGKADTRRGGSS
jgi:tripartite-type tricarboxylate transporter receptor subunit TctC